MRETAAAPMLLIDFVNTLDVETDTDAIASPQQLQAWLAAHDLLGPLGQPPGTSDVTAAQVLREGLRMLLLRNNGCAVEAGTMERLNTLLSELPLRLTVEPSGELALRSLSVGSRLGLGRILAITAEVMHQPQWARLKACRNPGCQFAFYDQSRNLSHRWCSMQVCGNRVKARRYRDRSRQPSP